MYNQLTPDNITETTKSPNDNKYNSTQKENQTNLLKVTIDRPLGSYHPQHKDLYYSVNYGYVKGIVAADGEEQDAYVLGVDEPIKEFVGKLIAVIKRKNDVEDKWVVAPIDKTFTKDEIEKSVYFQEKYFDTEIVLYE